MRIIFIMPECPYPANTGGRVVMWNRLVSLSQSNEIDLFSLYDKESDKKCISEIKKYCRKVYLYPRKKNLASYIKSIVYPYPAVSRWNSELKDDLNKDYELFDPDFIIVEFPQMMGVLPKDINEHTKVVLELHNIEYQALQSQASDMHGVKKITYQHVAKQMRIYEKNIYLGSKVDLFTFVSIKEMNFFAHKYNRKNIYLSPIGSQIRQAELKKACHNLIFVAKMSYLPNEEGAIWLIKQVFPLISRAIPDAKLYLVGKDPGSEIYRAASNHENVVITGTVDDLQPYYDACNLVVVPIMTGGGVNVKLLEALGQDKYVVTTPKGIEGTDFIDGEDVLVANDEKTFANYCIDLLENPNSPENLTIRSNSHKKMIDEYSWKGIMCSFEKELMKIHSKAAV